MNLTRWFVLLGALGCGREPREDPSAFTELGIPDARYQLGWGEEDVPWDGMSPRERSEVLRQQLVVLRSYPETRASARALLAELRELERRDATDSAELDRLRAEVRALKRSVVRDRDRHSDLGRSLQY